MRSLLRVSIVMPISSGNCREMLLGFNTYAAPRGWSLQVIEPGDQLLAQCNASSADAFVIGAHGEGELPPASLPKKPLVLLGDSPLANQPIEAVRADDEQIGRLAADHFLANGFRSFAAINPDRASNRSGWVSRRSESFTAQIQKAGFDCSVWSGNLWNDYVERPPVANWLSSIPRPAGVFACCDPWGRQLCAVARHWDLRVPEDIAVLGVDNDEFMCHLTSPQLSSVAIPWRQMGHAAAELVDLALHGKSREKPRIHIPPTHVVQRQSTDLLAVDDPDVAFVLRLIRERIGEGISVGDLQHLAAVGRHALQRRFRAAIGRTMSQEITRVRVEHARKLLATTELPMQQIARACGYVNATKFGVAFRQSTELTPSDYRRSIRQQIHPLDRAVEQ